MGMPAGIGLRSRINNSSTMMVMPIAIALATVLLLVVGSVCTETIFWTKGRLSDVLGEIKNLTEGVEKYGESASCVASEAIAAQVRSLAMEYRDLATEHRDLAMEVRALAMEVRQLSSQLMSIQNKEPVQSNFSALVLAAAAAALCALAYGIMWWKGLSFSDLMDMTTHSMTNRELIHRVENLNAKVDDQVEVCKSIRSEISDVRFGISDVDFNLGRLQITVNALGKYIH